MNPRLRSQRLAALLVAALALGSVGLLARPVSVAAAECGIPTCTLTVLSVGNGSGSWKTTNASHVPNGFIDCQMVNGVRTPGSVCAHTYGGVDRATPLVIYYEVAAATGSTGCTVGTASCAQGTQYGQFTLTSSAYVEEEFYLVPYNVTILKEGSGSVTSLPSGIACGASCDASFDYGTELTLTAEANNGWYFAGWDNACSGQTATCHIAVTGFLVATAVFIFGSPPTASPPAPTPAATAAATAKATVKPTGTPPPGPTPAPATAAPAPSAASSGAVTATGAPESAAPPTVDPAASAGPSPAGATDPPSTPAAAASGDLTPIALAILGAGLLIAFGIGFAAFMLRRRGAPPA